MLAIKIIMTVLISLSVITGVLKDGTFAKAMYEDHEMKKRIILFVSSMIWSILWRAFCIVAVWVI